jgi:3-oxoacyl-[acyl-carrier-protein] synthase II
MSAMSTSVLKTNLDSVTAAGTAADDVVITGLGMVSASGVGSAAQVEATKASVRRSSTKDYALRGFDPAPLLTDKRVLRAVSAVDAVGLVAIETLMRDTKADASADAERLGLYVGAPPATPWDNANYFEAVASTIDDKGQAHPRDFGSAFQSARPTTLLSGLPNNVLCYGAVLLGSRGANSNYTSGETSGQLAVINAARRIQRGRLDAAVAGGFSAHAEPVVQGWYKARGWLRDDEAEPVITPLNGGTIVAEGGAFVLLERRAAAEARGARVLATYVGGAHASDPSGLLGEEVTDATPAMTLALIRCLADTGVDKSEIGLVLTSATGIPALDVAEQRAVADLYQGQAFGEDAPVLATTARAWGNLMEAGGVGELGLVSHWFATGEVPPNMRLVGPGRLGAKRPYALVLRTSIFGEATCVLVKMEPNQPQPSREG